jgi:PKD repeat protein
VIRKISLLALVLLATVISVKAQLSCTNAVERTLTNYTVPIPNDSLFVICSGQTATLVATPPSGTPGWTFEWKQFSLAGNEWLPITTVPNVPNSTQANLQPGGYRVVIKDGTNTEVGSYIAWVVRINTNPSVSVNNIPAGCGNVQLIGQVNNGSTTPYYNPPLNSTDPGVILTVDASTEITVCYSGLHDWVSDMGFFLIGPSECGSPVVTLSPEPPGVCNGNDDFNNLCFSTESTNNFDPCDANWDLDGWILEVPSNYTGTYGSYGAYGNNITPIDWSPIYGCNAAQAGWKVQIQDCEGEDVGTLTYASLSFSGTTQNGAQVSYTYNTPAGFSRPINDEACSVEEASTFEVPAPPPSPIYFQYGYQWTANPPFTIPNSTSSLNITLNPGPMVDTEFTLSITGNNPGAICGGTVSASRLYDYLSGTTATITTQNTNYCVSSANVNLAATPAGGTWSGPGITNATTGTFSPTAAGPGQHTITYIPAGPCPVPATITMTVIQNSPIVVTPFLPVCISGDPIQLTVDTTGGSWSGTGIIDTTLGIFDPEVAGEGNHTVTYTVPGICAAVGMTTITVETPSVLIINTPSSVCASVQSLNLTANLSGGTWSGTGVNPQTATFNASLAGVGNHAITYVRNAGCASTTIKEITVLPLPVVDAGQDVMICEGESTTLEATGATTYTWLPETGLSSANTSTTVATPQSTTTYTVTGTQNGCTSMDYVTIIVVPNPAVIANGPHHICPGDAVQLEVTGITNITWDNGETLSATNITNPLATPTDSTTYSFSGTNNNGCYGEGQIVVTVAAVAFTATPTEGLSPLIVEFTNQSEGQLFNWDFGNGETTITLMPEQSPTTYYVEDGLHTATLEVIDNGITCTVTVPILVYSKSAIELIPNIVTADGNGMNDVFRVKQKNLRTLEVKIFNRFGNEVGEITTPDGFWNPRDNSDGTYYYVLKAVGIDNTPFEASGHFQVVR